MAKPLSLHIMQTAAIALDGVCLSSSYKNIRTKMHWRCAVGHEWWAQGQNVRAGKWCKKCNGKPVVTIDDMRAIARAHHGRCLSLRYVNIETKLSWRCVVGHTWKTTPHLVRMGKWCPQCGHQKKSEAMVATLAQKKGIVVTTHVSVRKQKRMRRTIRTSASVSRDRKSVV